MRKKDKFEIPAILDRDIDQILDHFNLIQKVREGEIFCKGCGSVVDANDIGAFLVCSGGLVIFCNSIECIEKAYNHDIE